MRDAPQTPADARRRSGATIKEELSDLLSEFARTMVTDFSIQEILDHLVKRIVDILPISGAGVTLIAPGQTPRFVSASDAAALRYEKLQTDLGEGPCLAAYGHDEAISVADLRLETRFPAFSPGAVASGLAAVFAFPLRHRDSQLGALDLYRDTAGLLPLEAMTAAQTLADVAASYLINAQSRLDLQDSWHQSHGAASLDPVTGTPDHDDGGTHVGTVAGQDVSLSRDGIPAQIRAASASGAEELLALLVADVQDYAILALDLEGNIVTWNAGGERIKGYRSEEIIGRHFSVFYPPEDVRAGKPAHELAVAAAEGRMEDEGWRVRKDGTRFWANVVITALRDPRGRLRGYSKVTRDLTERRAQERAVLDREQLMSGFLAAATECSIIGTDLHGVITIFNAGAERMLGHRADAVVGTNILGLIEDEDEETARSAAMEIIPSFKVLVAAARRGEAETREWNYLRKDGSRLAVHLSVTAVLDESKQPQGFIGIAIDTSERHRAEEALRAAEERFRRAFNDAPIGMAITAATPDALGRFLDVNKTMCDLTGYDRTTLLTMTLQSLTHPDTLDRDLAAVGRLLSGGTDRAQRESRYINAAGDVIDVSVGLSLIRDDDGRPLHFVTLIDDVSSRKRYQAQLQHMADHDPLTGLSNRTRFDKALEAQVARVRRYDPVGALLMIDIDHFKQINDSLGHLAGDQVLLSIARILQGRMRETDVLARLGGDEFAVLMTEGGAPEAQTLAGDLADLVRHVVALDGGTPGGITASIGVAVLDDRTDLSTIDVLLDADTALYVAKEGGRDRVATSVTEDRVRAARGAMHHQIGAALAADRFELLLQPVQDLRTGAIGTYEVLLRMIAEDGSRIPPSAFLDVAERYGQILAVDRWVIEHAVAMLRRLPRQQLLEINLSGRSLADPSLAAHIAEVIAESGADPRRLIFEITETAAIENVHRATEFAAELAALGCHFALDDFGSGFGSFYHLKRLPFDYLKIDGEFVRDCATNRTDQLVIQALVQLASGLGKETIAEFVEAADILRLVRTLGVDHAQGYEIAHPLPLEQILGLDPGAQDAQSPTLTAGSVLAGREPLGSGDEPRPSGIGPAGTV